MGFAFFLLVAGVKMGAGGTAALQGVTKEISARDLTAKGIFGDDKTTISLTARSTEQ